MVGAGGRSRGRRRGVLKSSGGGGGGGGVDEVQTSVVAGENRIGKWELERERLDQARDQRECWAMLSFLFGMEQEAPLGRLSLAVSSPGILIALQYNLSTHY